MAEIKIERKTGTGAWAWLVGLLVLALIVWAALELFTEDEVVPISEPVATAPAAMTTGATIGDVLANPSAYIGQSFAPQGEVTIGDVVSDRGFWITTGGNRMLVVLDEGGPAVGDATGRQAEIPDLNQGQSIRISEGMLRDPANIAAVQGPLDAETRRVAEAQQVFLVANADDVQIVQRP